MMKVQIFLGLNRFQLGDSHIITGQEIFSGYFIPQLGEKIAKSAKLPTYMRRRSIVNGTTLAEVVKGCDTYVAKKILPGPMING